MIRLNDSNDLFVQAISSSDLLAKQYLYYNLYYKWGDLYLCSAKDPLLEGSGNRRMYPLKGTSFDRVYVFL